MYQGKGGGLDEKGGGMLWGMLTNPKNLQVVTFLIWRLGTLCTT